MSEPLRIGLVAEGPTDYEIIKAALQAVLPVRFVMTLLQPENTQPQFGGGWGGVLKWYHAAGQRHAGPLTQDPTLSWFDLLVIHLDADVAAKSYADCGPWVANSAPAYGWDALPCDQACPPVADTCAALERVRLSWLGNATVDDKTIRCIPAQSTGAWLACAVLDASELLLEGAECNLELENQLARLPKAQRIKKTVADYRRFASAVTAEWAKVTTLCSQAERFDKCAKDFVC